MKRRIGLIKNMTIAINYRALLDSNLCQNAVCSVRLYENLFLHISIPLTGPHGCLYHQVCLPNLGQNKIHLVLG